MFNENRTTGLRWKNYFGHSFEDALEKYQDIVVFECSDSRQNFVNYTGLPIEVVSAAGSLATKVADNKKIGIVVGHKHAEQ